MTTTASLPRGTVVAIVSDAIYPYHKGGKEIRYHHVARELASSGLEVHVFTMKWWDGPTDITVDGVRLHALCPVQEMYRGSRRTIRQALVFAIACLRLVRYDFDVIDADQMPHLQLFTIRLVSLVKRAPLVVMWHEYWGFDYWREYLGPLGTVAGAIERLSARLADETVTPTETTKERLAAHGVAASRVTVVPNGVDLETVAVAVPSDLRYDLLYVGRLIAHKHVDWLVRAVAELAREGHDVRCAVVGAGPERTNLEVLASELGCGARVDFLGDQSDQVELFGLMKSARVFVLPSTREGFGVVAAEAIACGLTVVTTNHVENQARHLVQDGVDGFLCDPSPSSLATTVRTALDTPVVHRAPEQLAALGWERAAHEVAAVYGRALAMRRTGR